MGKLYYLIIDEGTTGTRALVFDKQFQILGSASHNLTVTYPGGGAVEEDAQEIFELSVACCKQAMEKAGVTAEEIICIGITNQRGTWVMWDRTTGVPLRPAIPWLDTRALPKMKAFAQRPGYDRVAGKITSPMNIALIYGIVCEAEPEFAKASQGGNALFGGMDTWLIWKLTGGRVHATSASSASSTMIFDFEKNVWDFDLLDYVGVPQAAMPDIKEEADDYGVTCKEIFGVEIPICSAVADQQSAMFAQGCIYPNTVKCTNGTGTFVDVNYGLKYEKVPGMLTMIAWKYNGTYYYDAEGANSTAGTCLEWAKNSLDLIDDFGKMEDFIHTVPDSAGGYFIPAFSGFFTAPKRDDTARGAFFGLSGGVTKAHLLRAVVEGVAFAAAAVMNEVVKTGVPIESVSVSGGVSKSDMLNQLIANVLGAEVLLPDSVESTALGAAAFAAIRTGNLQYEDVKNLLKIRKRYVPNEDAAFDRKHFDAWVDAARRTMDWHNWPL